MTRTLAILLGLGLLGGVAQSQGTRHVVWNSGRVQIIVPQRRTYSTLSSQRPIRIEKVRAKVTVRERAATTTLEISLHNPGRQAEAVLLLPVPAGAAIANFMFDGSAQEPTARILPKREARETYDHIVRKLRDPALLEFAGYNLIRSSVFPVPANGKQKIRLTYDHILPFHNGRIDYLLPRSESLDVAAPWDVELDIRTKAPISTTYSPSHEVAMKRVAPNHLRVRIHDQAKREPGPFRLSILLQKSAVTATMFSYPDPKIGGGYLLLLAGLPAHKQERTKQLKREVTLVIDRSGSMAGEKLDQVRAAALQTIEGLADGEAFNIIDYATTVAAFSPQPVIKSAETAKKARAYLASLRPLGGTNIHDALVEALRQPHRPKMLPLVLFLTDGLPTIGQVSEVSIRELVAKCNTHKRRVFAFGVGHDVNAPLLDRIAELSLAKPTYVQPQEDVELKVAEVFQKLYGPVLSSARLQTVNAAGQAITNVIREPIPSQLPDLFEGDQLVLLGQYRGSGSIRFRLEGDYIGEKRAFDMTFDLNKATTHNSFVPRLWASRRIAFLIDQIRQAGGAQPGRSVRRRNSSIFNDPKYKELVDEILRLSTEFGILSEYTAFLATEGTDLSDWEKLNRLAALELDAKVVQSRWGASAVARAQNVESSKKQTSLNLRNRYLDSKQKSITINGVQQVNDRALYCRGKIWIDGRIVAAKISTKPDRVVRYGTPEFELLLKKLVREGRQSLLAVSGNVICRLDGANVLIEYDAPALTTPKKKGMK